MGASFFTERDDWPGLAILERAGGVSRSRIVWNPANACVRHAAAETCRGGRAVLALPRDVSIYTRSRSGLAIESLRLPLNKSEKIRVSSANDLV